MSRLTDRNSSQVLPRLKLSFPKTQAMLDQDQEFFDVAIDGETRRLRLHDYDTIYSTPGLYEALFVERLKCSSPERVVGLMDDVLSDFPQPSDELRVLDVGAGNGMVGEEWHKLGAKCIVGVDIIPEAAMAAERDRPEVYEDYLTADLTDMDKQQKAKLQSFDFNCMSVVAALGFGDIPAMAFVNACNMVQNPGWLAFNIKETFLSEDEDNTGFCSLIQRLQQEQIIQIQAYRRYRHRLSTQGKDLHYVAMVAVKNADIPDELVEEFQA